MNSDDPKLTAYALDELDPTERAEIEQLLRENPDAIAEIEETKTFVAQLRRELKAEAAAPLRDQQRLEVLAVANERPLLGGEHPTTAEASNPARDSKKIVAFPLLKIVLWIAAACVLISVSLLMLFPAIPVLSVSSHKAPVSLATAEQGLIALGSGGQSSAGLGLAVDGQSIDRSKDFSPPQIPQQFRNAPPPESLVTGKPHYASVDELSPTPASKLPTVTLATSASRATPVPANDSGTLAPGQLVATSGSTLTKSGSGTMVLNGGNVGAANGSTAMPAEMPEPSAAPAPYPSKPSPAAAVTARTRVAGAKPVDEFAALAEAAPLTAQIQTTTARIEESTGMLKSGKLTQKDQAEVADQVRQLTDFLHALQTEKNELTRPDSEHSTEAYDAITDNAFLAVRENPLSTFSIDVDTASYANVRRFLNSQTRPPKGAVRIEELLNYFTYDYPQPEGDAPFSSTMEVATCPWAPEHRLVRIGLKGREIAKDKRPASNLVFLIDVSGSMQPENKLPLLKRCLAMLVDQLTPEDTVSIAVYAGASGTVLEPSHHRAEIRAALDRLESGGSTNGAAGIQLAYRLAEQSFIKGGVNRVILATDGDFNVGVTSQSELNDLITRKAKKGTFLTVLGFGMGNLKDSTLEKLADKGNGNYAYIDTINEGRKVLVEQMNGTLVTIAKDVKIQVEFNPAQVGAYRLIGYENRLLAKEDFNDDKKDAGEIGAGHTVTALYEVVPAGQAAPAGVPPVNALKYQGTDSGKRKAESGKSEPLSAIRNPLSAISPELLTLKLRYKQPDGDVSKLLEFPLTDCGETWEKSSRDFRFAASVAGFGMLLRESPHKGTATWDTIRELAMEGRGEDRSGYRGEFLTLLDKAKALGR